MKRFLFFVFVITSMNVNAQFVSFADFQHPVVPTLVTMGDMHFFNDSTGIFTMNYYSGSPHSGSTESVAHTQDFGNTFTNTTSMGGLGYYTCHYDGFKNSDTLIKALEMTCDITISYDKGQSWSNLYNYFDWTYQTKQFDFLSPSFGLIALNDGTSEKLIYYNSGTGNEVVEWASSGYMNVVDIEILSPDKIFMLADNGNKLIFSSDTAKTWTMLLDTTHAFTHIEFTSPLTAYVSGQTGSIYKTVDGGSTWNELTTGTMEHLIWSSFKNDTVGLFCGEGGTILRTMDGGNTFLSLGNATGSLVKIQLLENVAYCVNDDEIAYRNIDILSIDEEADLAGKFSLYPNPTKDQFTISNSCMKKIKSIQLLNSLGQVEYSQTIGNNNAQIKIDLPQLPSGIKYCRINGEEDFTYKIIIE